MMHHSLQNLLRLLVRPIWQHRRAVYEVMQHYRASLALLWQHLPLPSLMRDLAESLAFTSVELGIVRSRRYQAWRTQGGHGLARLAALMRGASESAPAPMPAILPTQAEWDALLSATPPDRSGAEIAVILPVYAGYSETLRCLYQVLSAHSNLAFHLCVINDASPDAALTDRLNALSGQGWFELVMHRDNQGFVRSVNEGMQRYDQCDIVLLNADTEVYDGWLDRLYAALCSDARIASVTPLSNHAELCSYPVPFAANSEPLELSYATLDALAASLAPTLPELPTGVGFCMAISRRALDEVGLFDAESFGRGYGEENDWCLRAIARGWSHRAAANVFVRHHGAVSFSADKKREIASSLKRLNQRFPFYRQWVRDFKRNNPLLEARRQLDEARLQHAIGGRRVIVMLSHDAGGGTERHIRDMAQALAEEGVFTLRLSPDAEQEGRVHLWHPEMGALANCSFDMRSEADALIALLTRLGDVHLHVQHLIGFTPLMRDWVLRAARALGRGYDITLHDYYFACPSVNLLVDASAAYVRAMPTLEQSQHWADTHPSAAGIMPLWQWREQHGQLLLHARKVFVPSKEMQVRMQQCFPDVKTTLRPHFDTETLATWTAPLHEAGAPLSVAIIGHMAPHKGERLLLRLAQDAADRRLGITYHLFGDAGAQQKAFMNCRSVVLHGTYEEAQLGSMLQSSRCQMALFASIWPETYSYTLSAALAAGVFPVCFDFGAPAERLRAVKWGKVLDVSLMDTPERINDALLALPTTKAPKTRGLKTKAARYPSLLKDYYQLTEPA